MREKEFINVFMKLMNRYCVKGCKKFIKIFLLSYLLEIYLCMDWYCGELL